MHLGIDVGGTNTDAVLMHDLRVTASVKNRTTPDVADGVTGALTELFASTNVRPSDVTAIAVGTTHFTNAVIQARGLATTGAVRLGAPATTGIPPMASWPTALTAALGKHIWVCKGGYEFNGSPISQLDPDELRRAAGEMAERGVQAAAITSVFSPIAAEMEQVAAGILTEEYPELQVSLSHEIGRIGLLERENATIINASLLPYADMLTDAFTSAFAKSDLRAPLYLTQNDGTWINLEQVRRYPVSTFAAGLTNSMRGATLLSGLDDCIVIDIGGTTTDAGAVVSGFPRQACAEVDVAGVRTNFRMPDVVSIGIGGGSLIVDRGSEVTVGPTSVGYQFDTEALINGGTTLTATDIAVARGLAELGDPAAVRHLDKDLVRRAHDTILHRISDLANTMRTSKHTVPLVAVGGGSILLPDYLPGYGPVIRPTHSAVANAIGAAMAQVGGEVDRIYTSEHGSRTDILDMARTEAVNQAVQAGAAQHSVHIIDVEEIPLAYLPGGATRVRVKAVGDVKLESAA